MRLTIRQVAPGKPPDGMPDVVLIHGTGGNAGLWKRQSAMLSEHGYRCFVPELRGHGQTPEPRLRADLQVHVQDILETLETTGIRYPAIFVGHSLGAIISLTIAKQQPRLVERLLSVSMPARVMPMVAASFYVFLHTPYQMLRRTKIYKSLPERLQILMATDRYSLVQIVENFRKIDFVAEPLTVECPVHFCAGANDIIAVPRYVKRVHERLPNSTFKLFERSAHCCMDDEPDAFDSWLLEKIASAVGAEPDGRALLSEKF